MNQPILDITNEIQSLTTFLRRSGDFLHELKKTKRPVVPDREGEGSRRGPGRDGPSTAARHRRAR